MQTREKSSYRLHYVEPAPEPIKCGKEKRRDNRAKARKKR